MYQIDDNPFLDARAFLNNCGLLLNGPYFHSFVFLFCLMF